MGNMMKAENNYSNFKFGARKWLYEGRVGEHYVGGIFLLLCRSAPEVVKENVLGNLVFEHQLSVTADQFLQQNKPWRFVIIDLEIHMK